MKKKATKTRDNGMGALLNLLKDRPELVHALIFDHAKVKRLLKSKAARELVAGVDPRKTLQKRFARAGRAGRVAVCLRGTNLAVGAPDAPPARPYCFGTTWLPRPTSLCCRHGTRL